MKLSLVKIQRVYNLKYKEYSQEKQLIKMQKIITRESLSNDIRKFGVKEGDVLYLRGNVGAIGSHKLVFFMIDSLLDV